MPNQALLFCPDEKTARTVTQVLSELDFTVARCSEPFAAVKRLMVEHFDALVVDCDNEQNATLLFKSAHNSSNNQASLAVAVVEGQAGVANAFRIGANLVLSKPINVEQAKGTLRVARGLLRKGEAAKPAAASAGATTAAKPAAAASSRSGPHATTPSAPLPRTVVPMVPDAALIPKPQPPAPRPIVASVDATTFSEASAEAVEESHPETVVSSASRAAAIAVSSSGAASAPARAREPQEQVSEEETVPARSSPEPQAENATVVDISPSNSERAAPAPSPSVTYGGADSRQSSGGSSNKALRAIVAIVLVAAAAYAVWTLFRGKLANPVPVAEPAATSALTTPPGPAGVQQRAGKPATQASPSSASAESTAADDTASDAVKSSHSQVSPTSKANTAQQPLTIKNRSSRVPVSQSAADVPDPGPLGIAMPGGSMPSFSSTDGSAYRPRLQTVSVSQGVSQGLLYKRVQPTYPQSALRTRVEGKVELLATISRQGDVTGVKVLSGRPLLAQSASDALKQWKYKPYLLNGEPVDIQTQITVNFRLPR